MRTESREQSLQAILHAYLQAVDRGEPRTVRLQSR